MTTTLSIAFLAGLISFLSPCVLPLIPGYISYISAVGANKKFGEYAIAGAKLGRKFGSNQKNNLEALNLINDYVWLKEQYERNYN